MLCFFHSIAEWAIPSVTGDIPPPMSDFSFTQISSDQAVMFGGVSAPSFTPTANLFMATVSRDSVVSACVTNALSFNQRIICAYWLILQVLVCQCFNIRAG